MSLRRNAIGEMIGNKIAASLEKARPIGGGILDFQVKFRYVDSTTRENIFDDSFQVNCELSGKDLVRSHTVKDSEPVIERPTACQCCATCRFSGEVKTGGCGSYDYECRRYPLVNFKMRLDWCGEWRGLGA